VHFEFVVLCALLHVCNNSLTMPAGVAMALLPGCCPILHLSADTTCVMLPLPCCAVPCRDMLCH